MIDGERQEIGGEVKGELVRRHERRSCDLAG